MHGTNAYKKKEDEYKSFYSESEAEEPHTDLNVVKEPNLDIVLEDQKGE
jgi:hypothetical protein